MDHRVTLIVASLTITSTLIGVGLERESGVLLLFVPVVAVLFGLLHIYHHVAVREIGQYLRDSLEARLSNGVTDWEGWHVSRMPGRRRFGRLLGIWHLPILLVTVVPSALALALSYSFAGPGAEGMLVVVDLLAVAGYLGLYVKECRGQDEEG